MPSEDRRGPYRITTRGREVLAHQLASLQRLAEAGLGRLGLVRPT